MDMRRLIPFILAILAMAVVTYYTIYPRKEPLLSEIIKPDEAILRVEDLVKDFLIVPKEEEDVQQVELTPNPDEVFEFAELPKDDEQELKRKEYLADKLKRRGKSMGVFDVNEINDRNDYILNQNIQEASLLNEVGGQSAIVTAPIDLTRTLIKGGNIPAILSQEIISTLPGNVSAKVTENVYAEQGRNILIPKGSKIIGNYKSLSKQGDIRLNIEWSEIYTPQGNYIKFSENEIAADFEGKVGLSGEVDNRIIDKYSTAMLFATITAASQLSIPVDNPKGRAIGDSYSRELAQVSAESIKQGLDIKPIIRIPKASLLQIKLNENITFPKPREKVFPQITQKTDN